MPKRVLKGNIVSNKGDKTVIVRVERRFKHPVYKKYITTSSKYMAHDETNKLELGAAVAIRECRPLSRRKRWEVMQGSEG
ncbi:30S ribosomal protein S17 [Alphaproteobacteria bacterium]|nr:30S ribosomal protein S17 [Alphaproteobacteria bacterium]